MLLNTTAAGATAPSFATQTTFATGTNPRSVTVADVNGDGRPDIIVANYGSASVSVLLNTTAAGATTPSFATQQTFATGTNPKSVVVADMNGDGRPDLIVANTTSDTVSVLLNTTTTGATTPSFATQTTFATGTAPKALAVANVNGDGRPDIIVTNYGAASVSVLLNTTAAGATTPSFATQQTFATGTNPQSLAVADVNGDGLTDLVVGNGGSNSVSVLLNTTAPGATTPSFAAQQTFATGSSPFSVVTADVNGDGLTDLIVANTGSSTVSVLLNMTVPGASSVSFAAQQTFATGSGPISLAVADLNGDGLPDLITANFSSNTVSVLLNTTSHVESTPAGVPAPVFSQAAAPATGTTPFSAVMADVNGDGRPDIIVANYGSASVSVLLNTTAPGSASPSFASQMTFATGIKPISVAVAVLNGDGLPDLIVANDTSNTVSVLMNTTAPGATTATFATQMTFATAVNPFSVAVSDLNGDGRPDIVVASPTSNTVSVLLNTTAPGATTPSFAAQQTFATGSSPRAVAAVDLNGDGLPDLITANYNSNTVSVLLNTTAPGATTPSFAAQQTFATGTNPRAVVTADVNGDGRPDIIVSNKASATVSVLLNTTVAGATSPSFAVQQTFATGSVPRSVTAVGPERRRSAGPHRRQPLLRHGVGAAEQYGSGRHHAQLRRAANLRHRRRPHFGSGGRRERRRPAPTWSAPTSAPTLCRCC